MDSTFSLPVGLRVIARSEADHAPHLPKEGFPNTGYELGTTVRQYTPWEAIVAEHMLKQGFRHLKGKEKRVKGKEPTTRREPISQNPDDHIALVTSIYGEWRGAFVPHSGAC